MALCESSYFMFVIQLNYDKSLLKTYQINIDRTFSLQQMYTMNITLRAGDLLHGSMCIYFIFFILAFNYLSKKTHLKMVLTCPNVGPVILRVYSYFIPSIKYEITCYCRLLSGS